MFLLRNFLLLLWDHKSFLKPNSSFFHRNSTQHTRQINFETMATLYFTPYLLTPWSRVIFEKLTSSQLVKKFPTFYGTRKFTTAFTSARHLSLFWATSIYSMASHPTSWRSMLILSSHLRLDVPSCSLSLRFPHQNPVCTSLLPLTKHKTAVPHKLFVLIYLS